MYLGLIKEPRVITKSKSLFASLQSTSVADSCWNHSTPKSPFVHFISAELYLFCLPVQFNAKDWIKNQS